MLLEEYGSIKRVYLPQYYVGNEGEGLWGVDPGLLDELNAEARAAYESQGYDVAKIPVPLCIPVHRGSLNCVTFETRSAL